MSFKRLAIAVSGSGRSLENFLVRQHAHQYEVCAVVSSNPTCRGVEIAKAYGLPLLVESFTWQMPSERVERIHEWLEEFKIDGVALAGFIRPWPVHSRWQHKIVNIHPALLPKYGGRGMFGKRVHEAVCAAQDTFSGATVHFVDDQYDHGLPIAQVEVALPKNATASEVADLVFSAECDLYPRAIDGLIRGELPLQKQQVWTYELCLS
jgi:phosphoribosylglycinamide formyltransferase 1